MRDHGPDWVGARLAYELQLRSGLQTRRFRQRPWAENELALWLQPDIPKDPMSYAAYRKQHEPRFFFRPENQPDYQPFLQQTLGKFGQHTLVQEADQIKAGSFRFFFSATDELGFPPDWHYNPVGDRRSSPTKHWSQIPMHSTETGDLKFIWEQGRFASAFTLSRAYWVSGNPAYAAAFWQLFESWLDANPPNQGAHWKCGQETSLRLMAWCFAYYAVADSPATTPERIARLVGAIAAQAERVSGDHLYAQLQRNNHAISEGVGLWTVGILFPELKQAEKWRESGRKILEEAAARQIYDDGAYVQHSTNYHRLMLHDYIWAIQLGRLNGFAFSEQLQDRVHRAGQFLYQLQDKTDGRVPNYGANDGALILPLNSCDYSDFRPVLAAVHYLFDAKRLYQDGPWHEDLIWLFGPKSLNKEVDQVEQFSLTADIGGYYTLRGQKSWGMIRCATFRDRPAQADMLHLDIWRRGENIALDAGTYYYYADPPWNNAFVSTMVHNTVTIDAENQMGRGPRFLWLNWLRSRVRHVQKSSKQMLEYFEGEHDGYRRLEEPMTHRRAVVRCGEDIWIILDDLLGTGNHNFRLHWLLSDLPFAVDDKKRCVLLDTRSGRFGVSLHLPHPVNQESIAFDVVRGSEASVPRGWHSPYYGIRQPAISAALSVTAVAPLRLVSVFAPEKQLQTLAVQPDKITINDPEVTISCDLLPPGSKSILKSIVTNQLSQQDQLNIT